MAISSRKWMSARVFVDYSPISHYLRWCAYFEDSRKTIIWFGLRAVNVQVLNDFGEAQDRVWSTMSNLLGNYNRLISLLLTRFQFARVIRAVCTQLIAQCMRKWNNCPKLSTVYDSPIWAIFAESIEWQALFRFSYSSITIVSRHGFYHTICLAVSFSVHFQMQLEKICRLFLSKHQQIKKKQIIFISYEFW